MKKDISRCLALFSIALLLLLPASVRAQADWRTFRNPQFGFRFIYPPDWQVGTPRGPNVRGKIVAPESKPFASCTLAIKDAPESSRYTQRDINKDIDSEVWTKRDWAEAFSEKFPDTSITETKRIRIDNRPAQFAVSVMPYEVMETRIYIKSMNFITMTQGHVWHFGCGAGGQSQSDAANNYEYWKPVFLRVFSSFVFEK